MNILMFLIKPLINGTFANTTDPITFIRLINNSPAINGLMGSGIVLAIYAILTIIFLFRIKAINAILVSSVIMMFISVFLVQLNLLNDLYLLIFLSMTAISGLISLASGLLRPIT